MHNQEDSSFNLSHGVHDLSCILSSKLAKRETTNLELSRKHAEVRPGKETGEFNLKERGGMREITKVLAREWLWVKKLTSPAS